MDLADAVHREEREKKKSVVDQLKSQPKACLLYTSAKADWLVGINATRLFSVLYHRTLNIGRVMSPTLALIVQREAEILSLIHI